MPHPDVTYYCDGSITLISLHTDLAQRWVNKYVELESWQWIARGREFAVDSRYADDLLTGMSSELVVEE